MNNPFIIEEAQARYQDRLNAADSWRLQQIARASHRRWHDRARALLAQCLIAVARRVQAPAIPESPYG
jgi:hypothetical protein